MTHEQTTEQHVREKVALLPEGPGVYQFLNAEGTIIYVGKAKNLKRRVSSYFVSRADHTRKVQVMVRQIADLRHIVVGSEADALLLENNLIKELQPRYNILLKDSKSYPWIVIKNEPFPRIFSTRKFIKDGSLYFGPYSSVSMQRAVLELIRGLYPLRTCKLNLAPQAIARGTYSVCLEYHIGNCKGPCVGLQSEEEYMANIAAAKNILRGDLRPAEAYFTAEMKRLAEGLHFEQAARAKDRLALLADYSSRSVIVSATLTNLEVVYVLHDEGTAFCNHMRIVRGAVVHSFTFEMRGRLDESPDELLTFALGQVFGEEREEGIPLPREVIVPMMPDAELFPTVNFTVPQRGDKLELLRLAEKNCKIARLEKFKQIEKTDPDRHTDRIMARMQKDLRLPVEPRYIECFDNSNIQGTNPVASCVVFRDGRPSRREYRHFNIKTVVGANDFASMKEVLTRRYGRLQAEGQPLPDLIVIDGGKGQLSFAFAALEKLGLRGRVSVVGLAKRMEEVYYPGDPLPHYLDKTGESLRILMHIRDEAHRFGITFHRQKRSINFLKSELENVPGLGKTSIDRLLKKYRTLARMGRTPQEELAELIGAGRAKILTDYLRGRGEAAGSLSSEEEPAPTAAPDLEIGR